MRILGQRFKRTRLVHTDKLVVAVEVEMVIPVDDPSEPCYESETIQLLLVAKQNQDLHSESQSVARAALYIALAALAMSAIQLAYSVVFR